mmetsp:Transcript_44204/g.82742  ORF Transcript_44204/g.82742 Transcript_44204/m.82742 type:complete len:85 (-) Transcript_44204:47-301(-)
MQKAKVWMQRQIRHGFLRRSSDAWNLSSFPSLQSSKKSRLHGAKIKMILRVAGSDSAWSLRFAAFYLVEAICTVEFEHLFILKW